MSDGEHSDSVHQPHDNQASAEMSSTFTDQQLIYRTNQGDTAAFGDLYQRYRDWAYQLAFRVTRDRTLAQDAVQETFLYLLKKFPGFELTCQLKTFLYPVVRHNAIALQQRQRRSSPRQGEVLAKIHDQQPRMAPENPAEQVAEAEPAASRLAELLRDLSDAHREVVLLRFVDDLPLEEIAQALEIPLGTVKSRLHHAIASLRQSPATKKFFEI